jgi:hypothetical protein
MNGKLEKILIKLSSSEAKKSPSIELMEINVLVGKPLFEKIRQETIKTLSVTNFGVAVSDSVNPINFIKFNICGNQVTIYSTEKIMPKENDYTFQFFELLYENLKD